MVLKPRVQISTWLSLSLQCPVVCILHFLWTVHKASKVQDCHVLNNVVESCRSSSRAALSARAVQFPLYKPGIHPQVTPHALLPTYNPIIPHTRSKFGNKIMYLYPKDGCPVLRPSSAMADRCYSKPE